MSPPLGSDLAALLARVEAASGPDRELDGLVEIALTFAGNSGYDHIRGRFFAPGGRVLAVHEAPTYTASLDASLALCERVLPGWEMEFGNEHRADGQHWYVELGDPLKGWSGEAKTPALALLAATLKALIASAASPESGPSHRLDDPNILPLQGVDRDHSPASTNLECDGGSTATEGQSPSTGEG